MNRLVFVFCVSTLVLVGCKSTCCRKPTCTTNYPPGPVIGSTTTTPEILYPSAGPNTAPLPPPPTLPAEPPRTSGYGPPPQVSPSRIANVPQPEIRLEKPEFSPTAQKTTTTLKPGANEIVFNMTPVELVAGRIATGRRPTLDDLDRLQANGFRTFLDLSNSTANSTARHVFDSRGLEIREVNAAVANSESEVAKSASGRAAPVYVFADDGAILRNWWQRYYKDTELVSDEAAKIWAARLVP